MTFGEARFQLTRENPGIDPDRIDLRINARLQSICNVRRWKALEADSFFSTIAPYQTGTVNLISGSSAVVGVGTAFTTQMSGLRFLPQGRNESYFFTFTDATDGALDRPYEGDSVAAATFTLYQNLYNLPADYKEPRDAVNSRLPNEIRYLDRTQLNVSAPSRIAMGEPLYWCEASQLVDGYGNPTHVAELYPIPLYAAQYPFRYLATLKRLADADTGYLLPAFITDLCVLSGVSMDLRPKETNFAAQYASELASMMRADSARRGPQVIRAADWMTRHRRDRLVNGYRRFLP